MQSTLLFYNVENLFDTLDDPFTNDNAYLPNSSLKWIEKRYVLKLQRIAKVLKAVEDPIPALVGLAEIENRKVLQDLVAALGLSEKEVGIVHADSPDERGMDVGLLFRKDTFEIHPDLSEESLPVFFEDDPSDKTRDVLKVPLLDNRGNLWYIYVTHWPSRKEGTRVTRDKRFTVAQVIRDAVQKDQSAYPEAGILVMGDLNCTPDSPPVYRLLDQQGDASNALINLGWDLHQKGRGSTNYRGKWLLFDQILVNQSLLNLYSFKPLNVIQFPWMLYFNKRYGDYRPDKTYGGKRYHGGYSDHLPVSVVLEW